MLDVNIFKSEPLIFLEIEVNILYIRKHNPVRPWEPLTATKRNKNQNRKSTVMFSSLYTCYFKTLELRKKLVMLEAGMPFFVVTWWELWAPTTHMRGFSRWGSLTTGYIAATAHPHWEIIVGRGAEKGLVSLLGVANQVSSAKAIRFLTSLHWWP